MRTAESLDSLCMWPVERDADNAKAGGHYAMRGGN
jgi:hypothetical protein